MPEKKAHRLTSGLCGQLACILEATAPKAGNVHRYADFTRTTYPDFLYSAAALAPALDAAPSRSLGETILDAVERTRVVARNNTNLGIVLLLAPLAASFEDADPAAALAARLRSSTVRDASLAYQAIRLANPRGLGSAAAEDVRGEPTLPLTEAMALASGRDLIARQYAGGFREVLEIGVPALSASLSRGRPLLESVAGCHLAFLAQLPDTLIERVAGTAEAREASRRAKELLSGGWPESEEARQGFLAFDLWLREDGNRRNPGAAADLTAAALFIALRDGIIGLPF